MFFTSNHGETKIPCTGKSCFGYNGTSDLSCPKYARRGARTPKTAGQHSPLRVCPLSLCFDPPNVAATRRARFTRRC
eukprot:1845221-Prymnesium_polylepis.2